MSGACCLSVYQLLHCPPGPPLQESSCRAEGTAAVTCVHFTEQQRRWSCLYLLLPWLSGKLVSGPGSVPHLLLLGHPRAPQKQGVVLSHPHPLLILSLHVQDLGIRGAHAGGRYHQLVLRIITRIRTHVLSSPPSPSPSHRPMWVYSRTCNHLHDGHISDCARK